METFLAINPTPLLTSWVKQYWFLSIPDMEKGSQRVLPANGMGLVFNRGGKVFNIQKEQEVPLPDAYIYGQMKTYSNLLFRGPLEHLFVILHPIGARMLFQQPAHLLQEQYIPIAALCDPLWKELQNQVMENPDPYKCVQSIEKHLIKRLTITETDYHLNRMTAVVRAVSQGEQNIQALAQTACLSYKQFHRIFTDYTGVNPGAYIRITRFSKALHYLQTHPASTINQLVTECGYYDKSHLIREVRQFSGYTPKEILHHSDPYRKELALFQKHFIHTSL
ncbi:MAG: helix-turn-helix domain-containing protein [Tannerellaceae bacterium]|nr:helix-turn-helix domain-containing protein [Tannerellaceae bacterium]